MKKELIILLSLSLFALQLGHSQGSPDYTGGLKVKLNEEGSKYFRIISWAQFWTRYQDEVPDDVSNTNFSIRRARILTYAQINKDFLILTHFGLNSLNAENQSPIGTGDRSQLFFHGVWVQYSLGSKHAIGGGLHYWNGISRLNNQSTLNIMTLDNNRQSWATIGLSDQFARHIGIYAKGTIGKLQYRVAINESGTSTLQDGVAPTPDGSAVYAGRRLLGSKDAGKNFAGYFDYNFLDQESNFLPYKVGSYIGGKKIFNVGAGFFYHPKGSVIANTTGELEGEDVSIFAIDAFYDAPIGKNGSAITAYATYQNNDYGKNYTLGQTYETGSMIYSHVGYVIPNDNKKTKFQPYASFNVRSIDAIDDNATTFGLGANAYFSGHNSKLTLEYLNTKYGDNDAQSFLTLQAMIYL
ncbi:hypothetical protein D1816_00585 [Aquimarina sp. AD10]|uniref:hypothetical protein n=1 Tax=Aquimarina TaxID=290174 RepID=UPI000E53A8BA|nr:MULTISPECIES: hypothetical protein [Aquimarina]AXT58906.1 hypothetical protein D1816_00585 [Aquimarina sp. AD10]RKM99617.1 hypothetical protein D7033_10625 [Aquimarina sp. AD10]